jgi:DNA-binding FadR family transcriptional regulator
MTQKQSDYEFIEYLKQLPDDDGEEPGYLTLQKLNDELGISISRLREQMEVARALGFIEVRPKKGIRQIPYTFFPAVNRSLSYALAIDREYFDYYSDLRLQIEAAYWRKAVSLLIEDDHKLLNNLIEQAWCKLRGTPIQIPQNEHRQLHLTIFKRLDNPFVLGLLEAYWDAYEEVGLNLYADYEYLQEVWGYHTRMVAAICNGEIEKGYDALIEHTDLLYHRVARNAEGENIVAFG